VVRSARRPDVHPVAGKLTVDARIGSQETSIRDAMRGRPS
jgi:hypothetical protein